MSLHGVPSYCSSSRSHACACVPRVATHDGGQPGVPGCTVPRCGSCRRLPGSRSTAALAKLRWAYPVPAMENASGPFLHHLVHVGVRVYSTVGPLTWLPCHCCWQAAITLLLAGSRKRAAAAAVTFCTSQEPIFRMARFVPCRLEGYALAWGHAGPGAPKHSGLHVEQPHILTLT